jgi:hypothetical protein
MTAKNKTDLGAEVDALITTNATGDVTAAKVRTLVHDVVDSMSTATDAAPDTSLTIDNGSYRGKFRVGSSSKVEVATGLAGTADASLHAAIMIDPVSGQVSFPSGGSVAGMSGAGSGSITGGGLGFRFDSRASAISATITSAGAGGPNWIATAGYATATDGGGDFYVRISADPGYSNLIWFTSADGQKWGRLRVNEPYKLEQAGGGTGATGAANNAAVEAINSIFTTNKYGTGYGFAGANFQLGYGTYNFASPWFVKGGCKIEGQGSAFYGGYSTYVQFPANSDGLVLGVAGSNGRLYNPSIYGDFEARSTVIRDLNIRGGWDRAATVYSQNHTTGQRGVGVLSKVPVFMENVIVSRFAEFGVYIKGNAGAGGSATEPAYNTGDNLDLDESYVCAQGYANSFMLFHVNCDENGLDGFRFRGGDCNAGSLIGCSATNNVGWGYNDLCFLGNWYWGNHAAANGIGDGFDWKSGQQFGAYQCYGDSQFTTFVANYSEGDFAGRQSNFTGFPVMIGGLMAGGFHHGPPSISNGGTSPLFVSPFRTPTLAGDFTVGSSNVDGEAFNINGEVFWRRGFGRLDQGSFSVADLFSQTLSGYSAAQGRSTGLGGGNLLFGHGFWLGGPQINQGFDQRFTGMSDGLPTAGKWARGDFVRMVNPSSGGPWAYVCTTGGDYAGSAPTWKSVGNLA